MYRRNKKGKYKHIPKLNLPKAELGMQVDPGLSRNDTWAGNVDYSNYVASDQEVGKKFKHGIKGFIAPALEWVGADEVGDKWREQAKEEGYGKSYGVGSGMGEIGSAVGKFFIGDYSGMAGDITEMGGDFTEARGYGQMKKGNKNKGEGAIQAGESLNSIGGAVSKAGFTGMVSNIGNIGGNNKDQSFDTFSNETQDKPLYAQYGTKLSGKKGLDEIIGTGTLPSYKYGGKLKPVAGADEAMEYEGADHEEGGIPVDEAGNPTTRNQASIEVEDNEVRAEGEVWSDELIPGEKITFAQRAKQIDKMRDTDKLSKDTKKNAYKVLSIKAERVRQEKGIEENEEVMAKYGKKLKKAQKGIVLSPYELNRNKYKNKEFKYEPTHPALKEKNTTSFSLDKKDKSIGPDGQGLFQNIKSNISLNPDTSKKKDPKNKKGLFSDMTPGDKVGLLGSLAAPATNYGLARGIRKDTVEKDRENFIPREQRISTKDQERTARQQGTVYSEAAGQMANPGAAQVLRSNLSKMTENIQNIQFKGKMANIDLAMQNDANLKALEQSKIDTDYANRQDARNQRMLSKTAVAAGSEGLGKFFENRELTLNTALTNKIKFQALNGTFENFKLSSSYNELIKQGKSEEEIKEIFEYIKAN